MGISVAEALQAVELENGRTYRCQVKDYWVELRVLGPVAGRRPESPRTTSCRTPGANCPHPVPVPLARAD